MKKYCVHCFDTEEIIHYIELNGEFGQCPVCNSRSVNRIGADRIGRFLRNYLADAYIDRKTCIGQLDEKQKYRLKQWAEQEGWQSIEEILIDDKAIFSEQIPAETQRRILTDIFHAIPGKMKLMQISRTNGFCQRRWRKRKNGYDRLWTSKIIMVHYLVLYTGHSSDRLASVISVS